jgi:hypothetical protein
MKLKIDNEIKVQTKDHFKDNFNVQSYISLWITHDFCIRSSVFFSILWCRASGNHPTNILALSATSFENTVQTVEN